ncbi:MAG: hypothetical protein HY717_13235 [Planctomycetes bacterium]|nr:hypothetical protein [Planctomycetota bacterium]
MANLVGISRALGQDLPPHRQVSLKLLSYNVHIGGDAGTAAMGQFVARQGADLVSLQEVPNTFYRDTVARIAGYPHKSRLELGKTILSRTPIEEEQVIPLIDNRSLLRISTTFEGIRLSIYDVHISWDAEGDAQAKQIINTYLPRDLNPRKIFIGDFNDEHFATQNIILESALCDAWTDLGIRPGARTSWPATGWSGSEGHQLIDLLLYDPAGGLFPLSGEILNLAPPLSDHRPVMFRVQLTDPITIHPPASFSVEAMLDARMLEVRFDREIESEAAADSSHYAITRADGAPGPAVETATVDRHRRSVRLATAPHEAGQEYRLAIAGIPARQGSIGMAAPPQAYRYLENLVANAGAEEGMSGWEVLGGMEAHSELRQVRPFLGERFFGGGKSDERSRASQAISLERFSQAIDGGYATLILGAYLSTGYLSFPGGESRAEPYDDAEMRAQALDAAGAVLAETSSGKYDTLYWYPYREELLLPPGSRLLKITLAADRKLLLGGPQNDAAIDAVFAAVSIGETPHGYRSGNLLANPGAEEETLAPWEGTPNLRRLKNYQPFSGTIAVAASGDGMFLALSARDGGRLSQTIALPAFTRFDYLRWGGTLRTFASRMSAAIRLEFLDAAGAVLRSSSTGPERRAEWTIHEVFTPIPEGAVQALLRLETAGTGQGAFADDFFAQVAGGPPENPWFARGDANRDGDLTVADAVASFRRLFGPQSGAVICDDAADFDDSGELDLTDGIRLLAYLFLGDPAPPPPGMEKPGPDPTPDALWCR